MHKRYLPLQYIGKIWFKNFPNDRFGGSRLHYRFFKNYVRIFVPRGRTIEKRLSEQSLNHKKSWTRDLAEYILIPTENGMPQNAYCQRLGTLGEIILSGIYGCPAVWERRPDTIFISDLEIKIFVISAAHIFSSPRSHRPASGWNKRRKADGKHSMSKYAFPPTFSLQKDRQSFARWC